MVTAVTLHRSGEALILVDNEGSSSRLVSGLGDRPSRHPRGAGEPRLVGGAHLAVSVPTPSLHEVISPRLLSGPGT